MVRKLIPSANTGDLPEEQRWCWLITYCPENQGVGEVPINYPVRVFDDGEQCRCFIDGLTLAKVWPDYKLSKMVLGNHWGRLNNS